LRSAQGDLARVQAQLINAQANARRQQELFNRGVGAQDRQAVMARPRTKQKIERDAEACGDEADPLQDAEGARQVTEPELVDERKHEQGVDGDEPQGVEKPR
jgi:multidrug efflux pump subunit AcrA (membrane-fusion protein)